MPLLPQDEHHLARALALAREAIGLASPNPTVGCVLARGSVTLGEGAHRYDRFDHAEIAALKQATAAGHNVRGATACVTLEPCSHHGRTGPCSEALIAAGITRCVVATVDPNPLVSGSGLAKLRSAGVEVILADPASPPAQQARRLNDAFAFSIQHGRPFVTLKAALSVDGKLAPPSSARTATAPHWLTGPAARADVQQLRHASDAILTGIGTLLADNPSLTDRTGLPRRRPLLRIILDRHLRTSLDAAVFATASTDAPDILVVCSASAPPDHEAALQGRGADILRLSESDDLTSLLRHLAGRRILSVLLEAGATLNGAFLQQGLVDKAVLYYAESELGLDALPFAQGFPSPYVLQQQLTSLARTTFPHGDTEDIRLTGYLHDPWPAS